MEQRDEEAIRREARILSASRNTKSASKDINKFFNREPPRLLQPQRGQNIEGIGFESDMNFYSITGTGVEVGNSIDAFAKDSDNVLVTNSKSAVLIAQQTKGGSAGINVGRNGIAVFPISASSQKVSRKGIRATNDSSSFIELSDDNIYADARLVPLCWGDQLKKEGTVVKETCLPPKLRSARTPVEQFPVKFKTLLEQDPSMLKLIAGNKVELSDDLFRPRSQPRSRPPSTKGNGVVSTGQFVDLRISNSDHLEDSEVDQRIDEIHKMANPRNGYGEKGRNLHPVSPAGSHTSERMSPPSEIQNITNETVHPKNGPKLASKNSRSQTADSFIKCRPTTLDVHDAHERRKSASSAIRNYSSGFKRINSGFRNFQRSKTICHIPTAGPEMSTSCVNKKFERIVFPVLYKNVQQKSLVANEDQVINVIISTDDTNDAQTNSMSAFLGANLSAPDRRPKSSSSRHSGTVKQIPEDVVGALGDSQASLVYSVLEKTLGASGNDISQLDAQECQKGRNNAEGSLISLKPKTTSSTHSSNNIRMESPQESEQPAYSTGIHVQIASKPAVTNPPPAPTPEPESQVYPSPPKTQKKVRIASPIKLTQT